MAYGGQGAEPFIGSDLRPDLLGGPTYGPQGDIDSRLAAGDASAKRELDSPPS